MDADSTLSMSSSQEDWRYHGIGNRYFRRTAERGKLRLVYWLTAG